MSYFGEIRRKFDLNAAGQIDAFGRQRVSNPQTIFDYQSEYDAGPLFLEDDTTGSATATHDANEACVDMAVTTASGDKVIRQTRQYHRYQPGKSQLILMTFVAAAQQANMSQKIGYFDARNGIFLSMSGASTVELCRRTYTSGIAVDNAVAQASWNLDSMDGTGPSGVTLDLTKANILVIDLEWLGVGSVRVGFVVDGNIYYVHQFRNANNLSSVYMTTANLPLRYEIENTGVVAGSATLKAICASVISEGGFETSRGEPLAVSNGTTLIGVTTRRPILSIRPKATFNSLVNRGQILLSNTAAYAETNSAFVEVVYNGTLTSASFASADATSITEYDIAATAITGGIVVTSFYVTAGGSGVNARAGTQVTSLLSRLPLTLDIAGANPINLSLVATSFSGTSNISGEIAWQELR